MTNDGMTKKSPERRNYISRRSFLKRASVGLTAPLIVQASVLGREGSLPPSERIGMGFIGLGGRGSQTMPSFVVSTRSECIAVCDVSRERAGAAKEKMGGQCALYSDARELIARPDIDAVSIATPEHWHVWLSIAAMKAGKDVYCEKPLSATVEEGRALADAAKRYSRVFLHGTHQRSFGGFRHACELALNGYLGKVHTIRVCERGSREMPLKAVQPIPPDLDYDMWLGPAPYTPHVGQPMRAWYCSSDYGAGYISNCGVHPLDIAQWGNGTDRTGPVEIEGAGKFPTEGYGDTVMSWEVQMKYANGVRLHFKSTDQGLMYREVGTRFEGTEGWSFAYSNAVSEDAEPKSLLRVKLRPEEIHLIESHDHPLHFLECVRTRRETIAPAEVAHRSTTLCLISDICLRLGRKLRWDPDHERFVGDDEANRMLSRPMREPWHL
jgi:predicted dehydrogenase